MVKTDKKKSAALWHAQHVAKQWEIYTPPSVPSKNECQIIEKFISRYKKSARILILGATPQFRDLAHCQKAEVTCVDITMDMILAMIRLMKYKKETEKEILMKSDWLKMPLAQNYYDFVLGDLVIGNIPLGIQQKFLMKIRDLLKTNGYFITRHSWPILPPRSPKAIIKEMIKKQKPNKETVCQFTWDMLFGVYKKVTRSSSTVDIHSAVKKIWQKEKNKNKKQVIGKLKKICLKYYPAGKTFWFTPKKDIERMCKKYFKIVAVKYGTDHPYTFHCPIYLLKKK